MEHFLQPLTLNNASDYRANRLMDYISPIAY